MILKTMGNRTKEISSNVFKNLVSCRGQSQGTVCDGLSLLSNEANVVFRKLREKVRGTVIGDTQHNDETHPTREYIRVWDRRITCGTKRQRKRRRKTTLTRHAPAKPISRVGVGCKLRVAGQRGEAKTSNWYIAHCSTTTPFSLWCARERGLTCFDWSPHLPP